MDSVNRNLQPGQVIKVSLVSISGVFDAQVEEVGEGEKYPIIRMLSPIFPPNYFLERSFYRIENFNKDFQNGNLISNSK